MAIDWRVLEQRVDAIVDGQFSDPVVLIPWVAGTRVYTPGEEGPDPSRQIHFTRGIFVTPGAKLVGESGRATGGSGGGFNTQVLEAEIWLSITDDNLGANWQSFWRIYDRVFAPLYNELYNISYIEPSATLRPNMHLIREHDVTLGSGSPIGLVNPPGLGQLFFDIDLYQFYRAGHTVNDWAIM